MISTSPRYHHRRRRLPLNYLTWIPPVITCSTRACCRTIKNVFENLPQNVAWLLKMRFMRGRVSFKLIRGQSQNLRKLYHLFKISCYSSITPKTLASLLILQIIPHKIISHAKISIQSSYCYHTRQGHVVAHALDASFLNLIQSIKNRKPLVRYEAFAFFGLHDIYSRFVMLSLFPRVTMPLSYNAIDLFKSERTKNKVPYL